MIYIVFLCTGFITGIFVSSIVASIKYFIATSFLLSIGTYGVKRWGNVIKTEKIKKYGYGIILFFIGLCFGVWRVWIFEDGIVYDLRQWEGKNSVLRGYIEISPISNGATQKFIVAVEKAGVDTNNEIQTSGHVLVSTGLFPRFVYGDTVEVRGKIKKPEIIESESGPTFNYPKFLLKDGVTEIMSRARVSVVGKNKGNRIVRSLYSVRDYFVKAIVKILPEPNAGLLAGIVLGTQTLSPTLTEQFRSAGLSHIVVLSGYNITIVAESLMVVALYVVPRAATFVSVGGVIFFVIMAGAGASAVRAGLMAIIALLGRRFGKTYDAGRALFFASFLMIVWNPYTLLVDPSFHLSFLATFAMIYVSPLTLERLHKVTERFGLREILATTLAVTLFVLPYIVFMSGKIALYSIPANIVVLPLVPLTMGIGLITALFGFLPFHLHVLGYIPGIISYMITQYDIAVASVVSRLPFTQITIGHFSVLPMAMVYVFYFSLYYLKIRKKIISVPE